MIKGKRGCTILMHRLILNLKDKNILGDHIDFDTLNNQRSNLRAATFAQNNLHIRKRENTSSKYRGVCWNKRDDKWIVSFRVNNKLMFFGQFKDETEAALHYNNKAKEYHGDFAFKNDIK